MQIYIQDNFINNVVKMIFDADLLNFKLKNFDLSAINDYYLRIFLVNDIDTNFISVFIPEILGEGSNFVSYTADGKLIPKPCEILISAYKSAPTISFLDEYAESIAFYRFNISCMNQNDQMENVIDIETSALVEFKIIITTDLTLKLKMRKFKLEYVNSSSSSLGFIEIENISQLLSILSKLIFSLVNSWFD